MIWEPAYLVDRVLNLPFVRVDAIHTTRALQLCLASQRQALPRPEAGEFSLELVEDATKFLREIGLAGYYIRQRKSQAIK